MCGVCGIWSPATADPSEAARLIASARERSERALAVARELGDDAVVGGAQLSLGCLALRAGTDDEAAARYQESLRLSWARAGRFLSEVSLEITLSVAASVIAGFVLAQLHLAPRTKLSIPIASEEPASKGNFIARDNSTISAAHSHFQERCLSLNTGAVRPSWRNTSVTCLKNS